MSVHYKFKAALDFSTITFDGIHISVSDLKEAIIDQKKLARNADFDLQIMNAQTNEVYEDFNTLIPKNTSVTVVRVPVTEKRKPQNAQGGIGGFGNRNRLQQSAPTLQPSAIAKLAELALIVKPKVTPEGVDLASMDATEEEKIQTMMNQATADYDPSTYVRMKGHGQFGRVPANYVCHKCNQPGHWIKDCPKAADYIPLDIKKSTGIPRSFMVAVDGPQVPGALITPEGRFAVPAVDHAAYLEKNKPKMQVEPPVPKPKIPDELLCNLCQDLLTDALLVPCCAVSYCDDCIRSALLESEDQECPGCHDKGISPNTLIPSRFLRTAVNAFKNETGYSKPPKVVDPPAPITVDLTDSGRQATPTKKLSLDELPDDLFPHSPRKVDQEPPKKDEPVDLYDFNDELVQPLGNGNKENKQIIQTIGIGSGAPPQQRQFQAYESRPGPGYRPRMPFQGGLPPVGSSGPIRQSHPAPHFQHQQMGPPQPNAMPSPSEPPPPGFEVVPPGEEKPGMPEDHRFRHEGNENRPPHQQPIRHQMSNLPFDPNQPPPGYPGIPPPGMPPFGPPPQGYPYPPFRGPPGPHGQMYPGPPPGRDRFFNDRRRPPYGREREGGRSRERERRDDRQEQGRIIEDPLEEFNRLMREKDRRKQMGPAVGPPVNRSRSPSYSPSRRTPSPFLKGRSHSRTFSRSPTPKRKRIAMRRSPYSRSRSRSPLPPRRVIGRMRSPSPLRRSPLPPRRAPPCSPSPPRLPPRKYEKDEYYDSRSRFEKSRHGRGYPREREPFESSKRYDKHERDSHYHSSSHRRERDIRERDRDAPRSPTRGNENLPPSVTDINTLQPTSEVKAGEGNIGSSSQTHMQGNVKVEGKEKASHHHSKKSPEKETKEVSKSPKKVKKEKKKHKKKSRDEKEKKSKKKKTKSDDEHSVTSGSRRDSVDTQTQSVEHHSPSANALTDKSAATTAICDSTVRSPTESAALTNNANAATTAIIKELVFDPCYKPTSEEIQKEKDDTVESFITTPEVVIPVETTIATATVETPGINLDVEPKVESPQLAQLQIPPSKWDRDDDELDGQTEPSVSDTAIPQIEKTEPSVVVTSEVVKRAENALFSKVSSVIRVTETAVSPKTRRDKDEPRSPDTKGLHRSNVDLREILDRNRREKETSDRTTDRRQDTTDRRPETKTERRGDKRDLDRRDRSRDRNDRRDDRRGRSRDRREGDRRDRSRERDRDRRERSRERNDRRDCDRRDRSRERLDRREIDRRDRDRGRDRANQRNDDRSRNRSRERSPRSRRLSGKESEPTKLKSKVEKIGDVFDTTPAPTPATTGGIIITRTNQVENWKLSDKFVPIGNDETDASKPATPAAAENAELKKPATPVPLAVRKQKGRINIKLSSAKADEEKSSSSSSEDEDEDDDNKSQGKSDRHSDSDDKKRKHKDKKKKAKRRRSNSTSSSSSDEEKSKRKKKSKKKKKKSKKSKK